ncbi:MAG TPA: putative glycolipid-binding domain-containing protein [Trebonia sp.]|nr:putative glycolipid-binding domain-containing protein [Trebonia sp.]
MAMAMAMDVGWAAVQWAGLEHVVVYASGDGCDAEGQLIMAEQGLVTVRYSLTCGPDWRFRTLTMSVRSAAGQRILTLARRPAGGWLADGRPRPDLGGCDDIDINCTPLTNTLPIRRLDWAAGQAYDIDVAYVSVPELEVRKARQRYTRLGAEAFRYESESFLADLEVDADGIVLDYPGIWRRLGDAA